MFYSLYAFALNIMNKFNYHHIIIVLEFRCVLAKRKILSFILVLATAKTDLVIVYWWCHFDQRMKTFCFGSSQTLCCHRSLQSSSIDTLIPFLRNSKRLPEDSRKVAIIFNETLDCLTVLFANRRQPLIKRSREVYSV